MGEIIVRRGISADLPHLNIIDKIAKREPTRRAMMQIAVAKQTLWVAEDNDDVVGYAIMTHSFFGRAFIDMVYIDEAKRGVGIGPELIKAVEKQAKTERIFTSTNQSNRHMQRVLSNLGYTISGVVNNLDYGDPEIFFSKSLLLSQ